MSSQKALLGFGTVGVTALAGYFLYSARGESQVAGKQIQYDAARASNQLKSDLPGAIDELKTNAKVTAQQAEAWVGNTVDQAKSQVRHLQSEVKAYSQEAEKKIEQAGRETGASLHKAVDTFDKKVEQGAAKAKSGISSWFGGSK